MRNTFNTILVALALAGAAVTPAFAQSYPRVTGTGENMTIDYGPMGQGALVGGGRVMVTQPTGMNVNVMHFDAMFAQQPREGFVPLTIGTGEGAQTVWVPRAMIDMVRRARADMQPR